MKFNSFISFCFHILGSKIIYKLSILLLRYQKHEKRESSSADNDVGGPVADWVFFSPFQLFFFAAVAIFDFLDALFFVDSKFAFLDPQVFDFQAFFDLAPVFIRIFHFHGFLAFFIFADDWIVGERHSLRGGFHGQQRQQQDQNKSVFHLLSFELL